MADNREILSKLKAVLEALEYGSVRRSLHMPWEEVAFFQDSETCLNYGLEGHPHPCSECMLMRFVPAEAHGEAVPCHHIPLDKDGNSIANLDRGYNRHSVEEAVMGWLKTTIARLESETAAVASK